MNSLKVIPSNLWMEYYSGQQKSVDIWKHESAIDPKYLLIYQTQLASSEVLKETWIEFAPDSTWMSYLKNFFHGLSEDLTKVPYVFRSHFPILQIVITNSIFIIYFLWISPYLRYIIKFLLQSFFINLNWEIYEGRNISAYLDLQNIKSQNKISAKIIIYESFATHLIIQYSAVTLGAWIVFKPQLCLFSYPFSSFCPSFSSYQYLLHPWPLH